MNMKNCGRQNVRKHRDIKDSDNYIALYINLKFGSLENMRITSSEPKDNFGIPGKGLITSLGIKEKARPNKHKKVRYVIRNVSMKDHSKIIMDFDKLLYKSYESKRNTHDPTDSYFYLARQLCKVYDEK